MNTINITERDLRAAYLVEEQSTYEIANAYGVDVKVIRNALRLFGVKVLRGEVAPEVEQTIITFTAKNGTTLDVNGNVVVETTFIDTPVVEANTMNTPVLERALSYN